VWDFAGNFWGTVVWVQLNLTDSSNALVADGTFGSSGQGWRVVVKPSTPQTQFETMAASSQSTLNLVGGPVVGINVCSFGRSGSNQLCKVNAGATQTIAGAKTTNGTGALACVGIGSDGGGPCTSQIILEARLSNVAALASTFDATHAAVKAALGFTYW